jgi:hypothetical protein
MSLPRYSVLLSGLVAIGLAGCGGGSDGPPPPPPPTQTFTIGGTLGGLNGTVVLQNNGGNNLSLSANGTFTFTTALASGAAYSVTVLTQPTGQTCAPTNGSGNASANVTNVTVNCTNNPPATVTIGGTVTGLTSGTLTLQNNLGDNLEVTTGTFTFPTAIASNSPYFVSVLGHPVGLTCMVTANGSGASATDVNNVQVECEDNAVATITVGGNVSGLAGAGPLTLRNSFLANGVVNNDITITSNGPFTFPAMPSRSFFTATVLTQPPGQTCSVRFNFGAPAEDLTNMVVECVNGSTVHTVGGTISGLTKPGLRLSINSNNLLLPVPSGATQFTFPNGLVDGADYLVGLVTKPEGMTCVVTNADGVMGTANVTDVAVACIDNTTDPLFGTYEVVGQNNLISLYPDGTYLLASRENDPGCGPSNGNGVELGIYNYDDSTGGFAVVSNSIDTNGECGLWDGTGLSGTVEKSGAGQGSSLTFDDGEDTFTLVPVPSIANTFIGSFREPGATGFVVFGNDGHYTVAHSGNETAGIEYGCYTLTGTTSGTFTPDVTLATCPDFVDTNDDAGFNEADGTAHPYSVANPYVVEAFERLFIRIVPN